MESRTIRSDTVLDNSNITDASVNQQKTGAKEESAPISAPSVEPANAPAEPAPALDMAKGPKVSVRLVPIGSTPAIEPRVYQISSSLRVATVGQFIKRKLRYKGSVHLYIQNSFLPSPDETILDLQLFKTNNELIISYCYNVAFG